MNNLVVTISVDITIDEEKAILIDSIMSKYDKGGVDVTFQRVLEIAFSLGAGLFTLTDVLKSMDKRLDVELEKRCKNESVESSENKQEANKA